MVLISFPRKTPKYYYFESFLQEDLKISPPPQNMLLVYFVILIVPIISYLYIFCEIRIFIACYIIVITIITYKLNE